MYAEASKVSPNACKRMLSNVRHMSRFNALLFLRGKPTVLATVEVSSRYSDATVEVPSMYGDATTLKVRLSYCSTTLEVRSSYHLGTVTLPK